ncbi:hypothetical protein P692DRAFT_20761120 [Suillus brevipes Sb2]|nr:hypothetical protein P692DRAFT_20761120 [Suillus brevipes Sb2]
MRVTKGQRTMFSLRAYTGCAAEMKSGRASTHRKQKQNETPDVTERTRSLSDRRGNCMGMITLLIAHQPLQVKENIPDSSQMSH